MKKISLSLLFYVVTIFLLTNCSDKNSSKTEKAEDIERVHSLNNNKNDVSADESTKPKDNLIYESYQFAENLKNDSFFESDVIGKEIELKNVGITGYIVHGNEVILNGIFYDKKNNQAIPRFNNNPPGRSFVSEYFDKLEIKYDEKYKTTYSATLYIILKNPKGVKNLIMYNPAQPVLNFEYKVPGSIDEFRSGFADLKSIKGEFVGLSDASNYPNKTYEIKNAELY
jgi:hypothetical protein